MTTTTEDVVTAVARAILRVHDPEAWGRGDAPGRFEVAEAEAVIAVIAADAASDSHVCGVTSPNPRCCWPKDDEAVIRAAERERLAAAIPPERLRQLADWFDTDDEFKTTMFPETWPTRGNEVQQDLRAWADLLAGDQPLLTSTPEMKSARERQAEQGSVDLAGDQP